MKDTKEEDLVIIDTPRLLPPSSDHYCTKKVAPPSDHLDLKNVTTLINWRKPFTKRFGGHDPPGYAIEREVRLASTVREWTRHTRIRSQI